jgi:cell division protein FtsQ
LFSKRGPSVLDAPEPGRVQGGPGFTGDSTDSLDGDGEYAGRRRQRGVRLRLRGALLPRTLWGRIAAGTGLLTLAGCAVAGVLAVRSFLLHDEHFMVPGTAAIQIAGNSHLTRGQLLSVFGEDVERNVFNIPLAQRRAELEGLPWVAHATVMRLLPNRVRVAIVERTPVAFVHLGSQIGLVDANGVLLDMPGSDGDSDSGSEGRGGAKPERYSFPVLAGVSAAEPRTVRAARMSIYLGFVQALDASGENLSQRVSEVDLSDPEDVKAIVPSSAPGNAADKPGEILVHFGNEKYLERYQRYEAHLAEWRAQYPRLAAVDMRYEQQAVLQMQPGPVAPPADAANAAAPQSAGAALPTRPAGVKADGATPRAGAATATAPSKVTKPAGKTAAPAPRQPGAPQ